MKISKKNIINIATIAVIITIVLVAVTVITSKATNTKYSANRSVSENTSETSKETSDVEEGTSVLAEVEETPTLWFNWTDQKVETETGDYIFELPTSVSSSPEEVRFEGETFYDGYKIIVKGRIPYWKEYKIKFKLERGIYDMPLTEEYYIYIYVID